MLPSPEKAAKGIRKLFQSKEERQQEKEALRDQNFRVGKIKINNHIKNQSESIKKWTLLAKQALLSNDEAKFRMIGKQILWTEVEIKKWKSYLLTLEILETKKDQVKTSAELVNVLRDMTSSITEIADRTDVMNLNADIENSMAKINSVNDNISNMMSSLDNSLDNETIEDSDALKRLEQQLFSELAGNGTGIEDNKIEEGINNLRSIIEKQIPR